MLLMLLLYVAMGYKTIISSGQLSRLYQWVLRTGGCPHLLVQTVYNRWTYEGWSCRGCYAELSCEKDAEKGNSALSRQTCQPTAFRLQMHSQKQICTLVLLHTSSNARKRTFKRG